MGITSKQLIIKWKFWYIPNDDDDDGDDDDIGEREERTRAVLELPQS